MVDDHGTIDRYIANLSPSTFLEHVEAIRTMIFDKDVKLATGEGIDQEFITRCRFIHQMETYRSLKYAFKHADIGVIEQIMARFCILSMETKKEIGLFIFIRDMV